MKLRSTKVSMGFWGVVLWGGIIAMGLRRYFTRPINDRSIPQSAALRLPAEGAREHGNAGNELLSTSSRLTGAQIAERSLAFIEARKDADGYYGLGIECDPLHPLQCEDAEVPEDGAPFLRLSIAEAYAALFVATGQKEFKAMAETESMRGLNEFVGPGSSNASSGGCPMVQGGLNLVIQQYYATKNDKYLQALHVCERILLREDLRVVDKSGENSEEKEVQADEISEILLKAQMAAALYEFDRKKLIRDIAERYLRQALDSASKESSFNAFLYTSNHANVFSQSCQVQRAVLDVYSITRDPKYLRAVGDFFDKAKIVSNVGEFTPSSFLLGCADALGKYSKVARQEKYRTEAAAVLQEVALHYWDYQDAPKINGDGGLLLMRGGGDKYTQDTAESLVMFSKFADQWFAVAR